MLRSRTDHPASPLRPARHRARAGALVALLALAAWMARSVRAQEADLRPDPRLAREFSLEVRAADLGDVAAQLSRALGIRIAVDAALEPQRVTIHAARTSVEELQSALGQLFQAGWQATGEGEQTAYRLVGSPQLFERAQELRTQRRARFVAGLLQTERALLASRNPEELAARFQAAVAARRPELPAEAVAQITPAFLGQTLLLDPLRLGLAEPLLRGGSVAVRFHTLPAAHQQLLAAFVVERFQSRDARARTVAAENGAPPPATGGGPSPLILNYPQARLEYRLLYGDRWSGDLLLVRVGAPDHWAEAALPSVLFDLPDDASLYPQALVRPQDSDLARRVDLRIDTDALPWEQALATVARAANLNVLSDSFLRPAIFRPAGIDPIVSAPTLGELLDRLAARYGYVWWKHRDWYLFRNRFWFEELRVQVSEDLLQALGRSIGRTGGLGSPELATLAALSEEQLLTLHLYGSAVGRAYAARGESAGDTGSPLDLNALQLARAGLLLLGQASEEQRQLARTTGLPFLLMPPALQDAFVAVATERAIPLDPADREQWRLRLQQEFERRRLGPGWAEVGHLTVTFDYGPSGSRSATLALRAPAVETSPVEPAR